MNTDTNRTVLLSNFHKDVYKEENVHEGDKYYQVVHFRGKDSPPERIPEQCCSTCVHSVQYMTLGKTEEEKQRCIDCHNSMDDLSIEEEIDALLDTSSNNHYYNKTMSNWKGI